MFKRKKHKIPAFPETIKSMFNEMCLVLSPEEVASLRTQVDGYRKHLAEIESEGGSVDRRIAEELIEISFYLLDHYENFSDKEQALAAGGVRYFITENDPLQDGYFASGLDDDARIMNHVLEELGIDGKYIVVDR